jgi:alpha-ribazole phosphatase
MMVRLLLVRHGETEWNSQHRYQGQKDIPLSSAGIQQARFLADRLSLESIDVAYASDLQRAWQTAQILTQGMGLTVKKDARLREMSFGMLEGLTFDEAQEKHAKRMVAWLEDYNQPPPGGEDMAAFTERVSSVLEYVKERHTEQTVLLVAHGGPLSELIRIVLDLPHSHRWAFLMNNAGLSEIQLDRGVPYIRFWNETCHLKKRGAV